MKNLSCVVLNGDDSDDILGSQIDSNQLVSASFQPIFADVSATGVVKIQMSNDVCNEGYQSNQFTVTNWTDIPTATASVVAGISPPIILTQISYRWMRAIYTRTSGGTTTGTVSMFAISL